MSFKENLLSKSGSYNYYKHEYEKLTDYNEQLLNEKKFLIQDNNSLKELNKLLELENNELKLKLKSSEDTVSFINTNIVNKLNYVRDQLITRDTFNKSLNKEIQYAFVFKDTIKESIWLKHQNFSLINAAANYSFMYSLYRILNDAQPKNILEMGLGQTTKLTTQYANYFDDVHLTVLESDKEWIENFSESLEISDNINIVNMDLENFTYNNSENIRFKNILDIVGNQKFDLIIIDGPQGFIVDEKGISQELEYSRSNIWELVPNNLSNEFIIVIDDYNRLGEQNTMNHLKELLNENYIEFNEYTGYGLKAQHVLFTKEYKYIGWI